MRCSFEVVFLDLEADLFIGYFYFFLILVPDDFAIFYVLFLSLSFIAVCVSLAFLETFGAVLTPFLFKSIECIFFGLFIFYFTYFNFLSLDFSRSFYRSLVDKSYLILNTRKLFFLFRWSGDFDLDLDFDLDFDLLLSLLFDL